MITKALSIPKDAQLVFDSLDSARNHINLRVGYRLCAHLQVNEQTKFTMPAINGQLPALSPFSGCLAKKLAKVSMKHPDYPEEMIICSVDGKILFMPANFEPKPVYA